MVKKLQRVFRHRRLTPEEIAADEMVRKMVRAEFPPAESSPQPRSSSLSQLVRNSIRESGRSSEELARECGVPAVLIEKFLSGERDIHLATADKLANVLGLEVTSE